MSEYSLWVAAEIVSLQTRADQLRSTSSGCTLRLAELAVEAEAALSAQDPVAAQKVARKIHLEEQRGVRVANEVETLLELIAARRSRHGLQASPAPATAPLNPFTSTDIPGSHPPLA